MKASNNAVWHLALPAQSDIASLAQISALRCEILAVLIGNHLFTKEEQLRANQYVHDCKTSKRLTLWLHNVQKEAQRRAQVANALRAAKKPSRCDVSVLTSELHSLMLHPSLTCIEKAQALLMLPHLSKTETVCLVGKLYVKLLHRNGKLDEEYGYGE